MSKGFYIANLKLFDVKHKQSFLNIKNNSWKQAMNFFRLIKVFLDDCQMNIELFFKFWCSQHYG